MSADVRSLVPEIDTREALEGIVLVEDQVARSRQLDKESGVHAPFLLHAVMVENHRRRHLRPEAQQYLALRMPAPHGELLRLADIHAVHKSQVGPEAFAAIDVLPIEKPVPARAVQLEIERVAAGVRAVFEQ